MTKNFLVFLCFLVSVLQEGPFKGKSHPPSVFCFSLFVYFILCCFDSFDLMKSDDFPFGHLESSLYWL